MEGVSAAEARRAALAAQGMPRRSRGGKPSGRTVLDLVRRQGVLQIDSVNVLARAHHVPPFSRLGPYDAALLDRLAYRDRSLYEGWSHAASLLPVELWPLHDWRRRAHDKDWQRYINVEWLVYAERVLDEVAERGPLAASDLIDAGTRRAGAWWNRSSGKQALEYHFGGGRVAVADRRNFERVYDLTERVIPHAVREAEPPASDDAHRALTLHAVRALGVGTVDDIADYFRLKISPTRRALRDLVAGKQVEQVAVEGWDVPAFVVPDLKVPRHLNGGALVSPFDPLVWYRPRTERLFGFRYRIEIYVPAAKRAHGYYVLPFALDGRFVARVDLKADRARRTLRVLSVWREEGVAVDAVAAALADELALLAGWLELEAIDVAPTGDLAPALAAEVAAATHASSS